MSDDYRNYAKEAEKDAQEWFARFHDEIVEMIVNNSEISDDLYNDYDNGDSFIHESYVDKWYCLEDAAELLNQLSEHEEEDSGLWEGQSPRDAISTQAAFTYGNAVRAEIMEQIANVNAEIAGLLPENSDLSEKDARKIVDDMIAE